MARAWETPKAFEWRRRLVRFHKSRLSVVEFCEREGVSTPSFYQWRKKLAEDQKRSQAEDAGVDSARDATGAGVGVPAPAAEAPAGFMPVRIVDAVRSVGAVGAGFSDAGVAVRLPGGTQLQLPTADAQALSLMLETLARIDAQRAAYERAAGGAAC
jgi:hypothetical protein